MSRPLRILRNVAIGLGAFIAIVVVATVVVVQTDWFRNYVRQKVITATAEGTGGRVEVGSFSFDWTHMSATVTDFVIHGNEPAGAPPYLRANRVDIHLRLFTSFKHLLDITYLGVDRPQANILVAADGSTNVPKPKQPSTSNSKGTPLQTVVDLAVGHFDLANGSVTFNSRKQDFDLRGESLRVQLWYDLLKQGYKGEISLSPMYVVSGRNTPVKFLVTVPVTLGRDQIAFHNARISTDASQLVIDGSLDNLNDPKTSAHIQGHVALADLKNAANLQMALDTRGLPPAVDLDVNATVAGNVIDVARSRVAFGASSIEASGKLQDPAGNAALRFQVQLALGELGRLAQLQMRPEGILQANGTAKMNAQKNYDVQAFVDTKGLSFQQGAQRIRNVTLVSDAHLTPHRLDLSGLRIGAFGAEITGNASLEDFARYTVNADLRHLDLQTLTREFGQDSLNYSGTISGPVAATGDLSAAGTKSLAANAHLSIAPGRGGIPVSGRLSADYRGDTDIASVADSYIALPHTRLTVNGSLGSRLNVTLNTRDLQDFSPLMGGTPPVALAGGQVNFAGAVTGRLASPQITGHLAMDRFAVQGRQFDSLAGDVAASSARVALSAGTLQRGAMQAHFSAAVGLRNWQATQNQPLSVQASVRDGDLADVLALAGTPPAGYSGALNVDVNVSGTIANPRGTANLTVGNGTVHGEPIDSLQAQVNLADQLVTVQNAQIVAGQSRINLTAEFHHPRDHFDQGQLQAHVQSSQLDLARLRTVQDLRPNTGGVLQLTADIAGELRDSKGSTEFLLTSVTADASGRGLRVEGQDYGDFAGTARTSGQAVTYNVNSNFAGSQIRVNGNTQLAKGYRTTADANIAGLQIERILALIKRTDIPAKGTLTATAHFAGTVEHPEGSLDATVARGLFSEEPVDRVHARVNYLANSIDIPQLEIRAGNSSLDASARFDHPAGTLETGDFQFRITNGQVDLAHVHNLQTLRPGIAGTVQLTASGAATLRAGEPRILARDVNLNFSGKGIAVDGKNLGELTMTANTSGGRVNFALDSNLASASIQGRGTAQLSGDYPLQAQVSFHNVTWKGLQPLLGATATGPTDFDAATDGEVTVNGPVLRTDAMSGRLQLSRVQLSAAAQGPHAQPVTIENQGPVVLALDRGVARIESLHLTGPQTDIQARGTISLTAQTLEASVNAHTDLNLAQRFDREITSSGQLVADATVRGTFSKPLINGKVELRGASVNVADVSTGLSNANGVLEFNGSSASFRNLTGEVGGGKVTLSGYLNYSDTLRIGLRVNATSVRYRLQPGVSAVADADLRLTGRTTASVLSGTVTIDRITYAPQSDFGAILSRAAPPVQAPTTPSPLLDNMKLDVQVRTSSATAVQASLAQNIQADANLHIQGTASVPGVLGRISINEGRLVFFSSSYTVNSGTVSFFNPIRIEPVLDLSLETQAKGVDVVLRVTGPIDNMKLTYTSDPPIQFQEIVGLLAAGQTPTSDPTLLANQPPQPSQSLEQMGASALLSKGLADPIANRLQRVFGITQFKIDPTFASGSDLPQAQLSLQQQVTDHLTLTYTTALDNPNAQALRGEFTFNKQWSATATRDQYGLFSVKFLYKKQFK